jgi:hypothetical protein
MRDTRASAVSSGYLDHDVAGGAEGLLCVLSALVLYERVRLQPVGLLVESDELDRTELVEHVADVVLRERVRSGRERHKEGDGAAFGEREEEEEESVRTDLSDVVVESADEDARRELLEDADGLRPAICVRKQQKEKERGTEGERGSEMHRPRGGRERL